MRTTGLALLLAITCALGLGLWFNSLAVKPQTTERSYNAQEVDYQIKGFTAVIFNAEGEASQQLKGRFLRHFPFDDRHEIEAPEGQTMQGPERWIITANSAKSSQGLGELHWQGDVNIQQYGKQALRMQTDYLLQQSRQQLASTDAGIIVNASSGSIQAQSMQLHTGTSQLKLKGQVNGVYQAQ